MLHSDIILGDLASNIWKNNKISYIWKKGEWILLKGDGMVTEWWLNGHWNVPAIQSTEWWLKDDWMAPFNFHGMVAFCLVYTWHSTVTVLSSCSIFIFLTLSFFCLAWYASHTSLMMFSIGYFTFQFVLLHYCLGSTGS